MSKRVKTAYILCGLMLIITTAGHFIDVYFGGINYILSSFFLMVLFVIIIVLFLKNIILLFKNRRELTLKLSLPAIIYTATFLLLLTLPDLEIFESNTVLRAVFKGTQNQAFIKLRANKTFELNWSGIFGYNEWFIGDYKQKGDTIFLHYKGIKPYRFGRIILIEDGFLRTIDKPKDSLQYFVPFKIRQD